MKKIKLLLLVVLFFSACKKDEDFRIDYTTRKFDIDKYSPILKAQNDKTISKKSAVVNDTTIIVFESGRHFFE